MEIFLELSVSQSVSQSVRTRLPQKYMQQHHDLNCLIPNTSKDINSVKCVASEIS